MALIPFQFEQQKPGPSRVVQRPRNQEMINAALQEAKAFGAGKDIIDGIIADAVAEEDAQIRTEQGADISAYKQHLKFSEKKLFQDLELLPSDGDIEQVYAEYEQRNSEYLDEPSNIMEKSSLELLKKERVNAEKAGRLNFLLAGEKRDAEMVEARYNSGVDLAIEQGDVEGLAGNIAGLVANGSLSVEESEAAYVKAGQKLEGVQNDKNLQIARGMIAQGERDAARAMLEEQLTYSFTTEDEGEQSNLKAADISKIMSVGELDRLRNQVRSIADEEGKAGVVQFEKDIKSGKLGKDLKNKNALFATTGRLIQQMDKEVNGKTKKLFQRIEAGETIVDAEFEAIGDEEIASAMKTFYETEMDGPGIDSPEYLEFLNEVKESDIFVRDGWFLATDASKEQRDEFFNRVAEWNGNLQAKGAIFSAMMYQWNNTLMDQGQVYDVKQSEAVDISEEEFSEYNNATGLLAGLFGGEVGRDIIKKKKLPRGEFTLITDDEARSLLWDMEAEIRDAYRGKSPDQVDSKALRERLTEMRDKKLVESKVTKLKIATGQIRLPEQPAETNQFTGATDEDLLDF